MRIAKWPREATSPVCLMIDDLTDGWIDRDGSGVPRGRNDWGAGMDEAGSSFRFLTDRVLADFPEVRTTFFVPVDRVEDVRPARFRCEFRPIDRRPEFVRFLRALEADERFECAYHGKEHGHPGKVAEDYLPEFASFGSLAEALDGLRAGAAIWKGVFDAEPTGGKYPAYTSGAHGDAAIDSARYAWWCRRWDRGDTDADPSHAFEPRFFGANGTVDVPSTVHGGLMTLPPLRRFFPRGIPYYALARLRSGRWLDEQIADLLARRAVISVQEHITSSRPDEHAQSPNLYDDTRTLRRIFRQLRRHDVWHATCGEIADYFRTREQTTLVARGPRDFEVRVAADSRRRTPLSIVVPGLGLADAFALRSAAGVAKVQIARQLDAGTVVTEPIALSPGAYQIEALGAP